MGHVLGGIALGVMVGYPFGGLLYDQVGAATPFLLISLAIAGLLMAEALLFPFVVTTCTGERATAMSRLLSDKYAQHMQYRDNHAHAGTYCWW